MKRINHISIPTPCTQSWDSMLPDAQGRFCNSCQKSVIDFSGLSNAEIIKMLSKSGDICGKFGENQMANLNNQLAAPKNSFSWKKFSLAASIIAFMPFINANAQVKAKTEHRAKPQNDSPKPINSGFFKTICGVVMDSVTKQPVAGAWVSVKGNNIVVTTNDSGNFEMEVWTDENPVLLFESIGHVNKQVAVNSQNSFYSVELAVTPLSTDLQLSRIQNEISGTVGGVAVIGVEITKREDPYFAELMRLFFR